MLQLPEASIAIIGTGYVGLPLAIEFGRKYPTVGYDINRERISDLRGCNDATQSVDRERFIDARYLSFSAETDSIAMANTYIVTVPTPITKHKQPDLSPLIAASTTVGGVLRKGGVVIYESTVYPGATEEVCVPVLERVSGLKYNRDFFVGYSPERINPGDKEHTLRTIVKITSGSNVAVAEYVDSLYASIIDAGTYPVSSMRVAEAAKVLENTQRDVNIALMNELAVVLHCLDVDTQEVLAAAGTKWNFLPFTPGLVGGHCVGIDPYYLTHRAQVAGHNPALILAGRQINDAMGAYVAGRVIELHGDASLVGVRALVMGFSFKANCPDIRNTRVIDIVRALNQHGIEVDVFDPCVDEELVKDEYDVTLVAVPDQGSYDIVILAVAHAELLAADPGRYGKAGAIIFDVQGVMPQSRVSGRL